LPPFVAVTVNVYTLAFVSPVTCVDRTPDSDATVTVFVTGDAAPEVLEVPVTVYEEISEPPESVGAVHETVAVPSPAVTVGANIVDGGPTGVDETGAEAALSPRKFRAFSVNEYFVPFVSPVTSVDVEDPETSEGVTAGAGVTATTYAETVLPLLSTAVHDNVTFPFPDVVVIVGADGTSYGVALADGADFTGEPERYTASTRNVYAVPSVKPVTVLVVCARPLRATWTTSDDTSTSFLIGTMR